MLQAADTIRRVFGLRAGELTAPPMVIARIEGALVALEVIVTGFAPLRRLPWDASLFG